MKKSELKTGMKFYFANGDVATVLLNTRNGDIIAGDTWLPLCSYNEDISKWNISSGRIEKITSPIVNCSFINSKNKNHEEVLWEAPPEIDITVMVNGKKVPLNTISEETLLKIRNA